MTTDKALEIYWNAYKTCPEIVVSGIRKVKQRDLEAYAMGEVLKAYDKEWAERYLAIQDQHSEERLNK